MTEPTETATLGRPVGVHEGFRRRFLYLCISRVMVCTVIFGSTVAANLAEGNNLDAPTPRLLITIVLAIYLASLGYMLQVRRASPERLRALSVVGIAGDLFACSALAFATGGVASPLTVLYALTTVTAALVLGGKATLWTAVAALGSYGTLGLLMGIGALPPLDDRLRIPDPIEATFQTVVTLTAVICFAAIGDYLADRLVLADDALVRSEENRADLAALYEDVLRSIPVVLVTFDAEGLIASVNPNGARLLGVQIEALLGGPVRTHLPFMPESALHQGSSATGDATVTTTDGDVAVSYRVAPLRDRDGHVDGGIVVIEDRSAEEELRAAVENAERFAELGRLAAGLAHEIRNPLGGISGCVELVRESARLDPEERGLLQTVSGDVKRLNDLVTEMLFFARPRPPEPIPCDLHTLAREVVTLARSTEFAKKHVELRLLAEPDVTVPCDPDQIKQVVWNLLRNALQVSGAGSVVDLALVPGAESVMLDVRDRGPGVDEALRGRIFQAYVSGTARGSGIGLAIVKRIADAHFARLEVLPREGGGSTFRIEIPRVFGKPRRGSNSQAPAALSASRTGPQPAVLALAAIARLDSLDEERGVLDGAGHGKDQR